MQEDPFMQEPLAPNTSQEYSYTDEYGNYHHVSRSSTFTSNEQSFQNFSQSFDGPLSSAFAQASRAINGAMKINNPTNTNTQSHYWAKWDYTPEEWQRFDRFDFRQATIYMLVFAAISVFFYLLAAFFLFTASYSVDDSGGIFLFIAAFLVPLLLFLPLFFHITRHYLPRVQRHRTRIHQNIRRVTIGPVSVGDPAIWEAGQHIPLQSLFFTLKHVQFKEQPIPRLHFRRRHLQIRQSSWNDSIEIPVPAGRENEARALVQRFYQEIIHRQRVHMPAEPQ